MSQLQTINVGNIANDGTGDDLREAFIKVNNNLLYLEDSAQEPSVVGINLGEGGEGLYASKTVNDDEGVQLNFKQLKAGNNVSLQSDASEIKIHSSGGISAIELLADDGHITIDDNDSSVPMAYILGGEVITTRQMSGDRIIIDLKDKGIVERDTEPKLSASLQANFKNIQNVNNLNAQSIQGNLEGLVYGIDVRNINDYFANNWNFGEIIPRQINSIIEYFTISVDVDLGSFTGEKVALFDIDLGEL